MGAGWGGCADGLNCTAPPLRLVASHAPSFPLLPQLCALISDAEASDAQDFFAGRARDIVSLADACIAHARPHQLNLVLSLAGLHQTSSASHIMASADPPLLHRAALLPVFNPSIICTVLAHLENVNVADAAGQFPLPHTAPLAPLHPPPIYPTLHHCILPPSAPACISHWHRQHGAGTSVCQWHGKSSGVPH